jgi:hypothetical protein
LIGKRVGLGGFMPGGRAPGRGSWMNSLWPSTVVTWNSSPWPGMRTGRAGASGTSISFACEDDAFLLGPIEQLLGQKLPCTQPGPELLEHRR